MTRAIGIRRSPRLRNSRGCFTYIEADEERIWPQARRRPTRSAANGVQVDLDDDEGDQPEEARQDDEAAVGFRSSEVSAPEPRPRPQKKSVAPVPSTPPVGTA